MATIAPFRGITYDERALGAPLGEAVCEPYDKIDEKLRRAYLVRHLRSCVRLILGHDDDPVEDPSLAKLEAYARARALFDRWLGQGALVRAPKPALYVLEQRFELDGRSRVRRGLIARFAVDGDDVRFHERTFAGPKGDRRRLLDATDAEFDQVFFLADDADGKLRAALARSGGRTLTARPEAGREDRLVLVDDAAAIAEISRLASSREVTIADGHHRFEMARERWLERKRDGRATEADRFRTAALFAAQDEGLAILPTHRLVRLPSGLSAPAAVERIAERLSVAPVPGQARDAALSRFARGVEPGTVGLYGRALGGALVLRPRADHDPARVLSHLAEPIRGLPVAWLHGLALDPVFGEARHDVGDRIGYQRGVAAGVARVDAGEYDLVFCLPPTDVQDVMRCGRAGARMPQKSTDFYPKLLSGLVMDDKRN